MRVGCECCQPLDEFEEAPEDDTALSALDDDEDDEDSDDLPVDGSGFGAESAGESVDLPSVDVVGVEAPEDRASLR